MATETQQATIKTRRDTAANWTSNDPTPLEGEWCLETDTKKIKIGDGSTAWSSLDYCLYDKDRICTAWVNFNGTGTVAIRDSYNVSSITDNGAGNYTVNFTNTLSDTNYCVVASTDPMASSNNYAAGYENKTTTSVDIFIEVSSGSALDRSDISAIIFGGIA